MMIGGLIGWVLFPPWLLRHGLIAPDAKRVDILLTVMWPAVGMLVAGGIAGLAAPLAGAAQELPGAHRGARRGVRPAAPLGRGLGSAASAVVLIVVQRLFFGTPVWHSVIAILLALPLGLVALRVLGETNWGPISTMVNLVQAIFGVLAPGDLRASMVSSGITGAVAAESEGLMQDFKAGWMIGSTPRILTYMQLMAVPVGALALAVMYPLHPRHVRHHRRARPAPEPDVAALGGVRQGGDARVARVAPSRAAAAARVAWMKGSFACGAAIGVLLTLLELGKVAPIRALAHRDGHRDADPVQRGDGHLLGRDARRALERVAPQSTTSNIRSRGVGAHRGRSTGRGGDSAAGDAGADEAMRS